ncbi:helix-turn-helix transcriptional regulator [Bradyrhizobium sp. 156]|nr:helix-turn-helix transcriptional regulator [Bradyrhizobium sp. 156]
MHPLRSFRQNHDPKLSQAALAEMLDVARLTVLRWENGQRKIDDDLLPRITDRTGISAKYLRPDLYEKHERLFGEAAQ